MKIIERFDIYMEYKHLNDNKVTVQLGLSNGVIGKSRKDGRDLSYRVIEQILNFYTDLSREWLLYGEGDMLLPAGNSQVIGNNSGTAINGDGTVVHPAGDVRTIVNNTGIANNGDNAIVNPPAPSRELDTMLEMLKMKDAQIGELIFQNGKLMNIIETLTQK